MLDKTLKDIETALTEVVELQKDYVSEVCSRCLHPCCKRVGYIYSEKDVLFLRLSGKKQPAIKKGPRKKGCSFHASDGCLLDALLRPFICHRYICPDLETIINENNPEILKILEGKFILIDGMRSRMWSEYLDSIIAAGVEGEV